MKARVDREFFLHKLGKAIGFVPSKAVVPAFEDIKLTFKDNSVEMVTSDGSMQFRTTCVVKSCDEFSVCLPARLLIATFALFRENEVIITKKSDVNVELKCGKSKYNIGTYCDPKDYPTMSIEDVNNEICISQLELKEGLKSADKFIDSNNTIDSMLGVNISEVDNKIVFIGLDMFVMCRYSSDPISISKWDNITISTDLSSNMCKLLSDKGEVSIAHSGKKVIFSTPSDGLDYFEVISVVSNAKFPNAESLFSKDTPHNIKVNTMEMSDAVKRIKLYATKDKESKFSILINESNNTEMKITAEDVNFNKNGEEIVSCENTSKCLMDKSFTAEKFLKPLNIFNDQYFDIGFSDNVRQPIKITPSNENKDKFKFLISVTL